MKDDDEAVRRGSLRLEGQVVDEHGEPVACASVSLDTVRCVASADDGRFGFDDLAAGLYRLSARRDELCADVVLVMLYEGRDRVVLTMSPGITLRLHVMAGEIPVADARVRWNDELVGVTDGQGLAVVLGVCAEFQLFEITANGYAPAQLSMWLAPDPRGTVERTARLTRGAPLGGLVVGPDGAAVADATVRISGESWGGEVTTDARGAWRVAAVAAGTYRLVAYSPTHAPAAELVVELDGNAARADVTVTVTRGGTLVGRVVDASGAVVARPFLVLIDTVGEHPCGRTVRGDDAGQVELRGVKASTYRVLAHEGHRASAEAVIVVSDGDASRLELVLERGGIAGVVVDGNGLPIAGAEVRASGDRLLLRGDVTDRQGRFDLGGFPPGQHEVRARWPTQQERSGGASTSAVAGDTSVRLVLPAAATIVGRVLLDGAPMQRFGVLLTTSPEFPWIGRPLGVHDADGRFVLSGVTAGDWGIVVAGPGTEMHTISTVSVAAGGVADVGEIHLARGQRVRGRVRDAAGTPVAGARVAIGRLPGDDELDPLQRWFSGDLETRSDAEGGFAFDAISSVRTPGASRPVIAASHPDRGASIALPVPEGDPVIDLTLVETGTIEGTVAGFTGRSAWIGAHRRDEPPGLRGADLRASGRFVLERLPPGDYSITMTSFPRDPTLAPVEVSVAAGARTIVHFVVEPG